MEHDLLDRRLLRQAEHLGLEFKCHVRLNITVAPWNLNTLEVVLVVEANAIARLRNDHSAIGKLANWLNVHGAEALLLDVTPT